MILFNPMKEERSKVMITPSHTNKKTPQYSFTQRRISPQSQFHSLTKRRAVQNAKLFFVSQQKYIYQHHNNHFKKLGNSVIKRWEEGVSLCCVYAGPTKKGWSL